MLNQDANQKPVVRNAASEKQVKEGRKQESIARSQELNDLRAVLSTKEGRRFYWRLMSKCRVFETIWDNSAKIHYNSGRQDVGHYLMAEMLEANENALIEMMKEKKEILNG